MAETPLGRVIRLWAEQAEDTADSVIREFNKFYMVVNDDGRVVIFQERHDPVLDRHYHCRIGFEDFRRLYLNRRVAVGQDDKGNPKSRCAADIWLHSPDRREYRIGVTFDPSGKRVQPGELNLWRGFAVEPRKGDWSRLQEHMHDVVSNKNEALFNYLMGWCARMVQHPTQQGETAIVMKGLEGCGKGTVARALMRVMGQHGMAISNAKHLVGNFNSHLRDCVFLFADEAFFAGDKQHEGVLKSIITEPYLTIEGKYQNAVQAPNFLHVMMASNKDWVVPASAEARRFVVYVVSDSKVRNYPYFKDIWAQMDDGGYEAMLHDLLNYDLTHFNVRDIPITEGLKQQKRLSFSTENAWWADVLSRRYVHTSKHGLERHFAHWQDVVSTELLYNAYLAFAERKHERRPLSREDFGRFMIGLGAKPTRPAHSIVGEHVADVIDKDGRVLRKAEPIWGDKKPAYALGSLDSARAAFAAKAGIDNTWDDDAANEEQST